MESSTNSYAKNATRCTYRVNDKNFLIEAHHRVTQNDFDFENVKININHSKNLHRRTCLQAWH